jgi:HK97 gp10 family phage protein
MSEIQGLDSLLKKLESMDSQITDYLFKSVARETKVVQADAKLNCPVNHGELRGSIMFQVSKTKEGVMGIVSTNKEYAAYVEFGTGPVGQANHEGISPNVNITYSQKGWAFPASEVSAADAAQYKWPKRTYGGEDYYVTSGQRAQPFMYPALKNHESTAKKNIKKDMNEFMKGYSIK